MSDNNLYLSLVHFPVINRKNDTISSALTTIDLHDISRACMTFGVKRFYVIIPFEDQVKLAFEVIEHWTRGAGGRINPFRKEALELIRITRTFQEAVLDIEEERNEPVVKIATSARTSRDSITAGQLKQMIVKDRASHMIVFGTAWGLAEELIDICNFILEPVKGKDNYNHLSVRSAVSIYLDRITNG